MLGPAPVVRDAEHHQQSRHETESRTGLKDTQAWLEIPAPTVGESFPSLNLFPQLEVRQVTQRTTESIK